MAKFDEEKFRALAKAAGYGDAEIEAEIKLEKAPAGAAVPNIVPIADGRDTTAAFEKEAQAKGAELITSAKEEKEKTLTEPPFDFVKAINSPVGYVTGAAAIAALTAGAGYAFGKAKSGLSGINQRKIGTRPEIDRNIDIPMDTVEKRNMSPFAQQFETTYGVPLADAERLTGGVAPTLATFNRDANGNIQYPKGMSDAAKQGAEAFAQQYPDNAKALAAEGRFGILGAGSGDNNLFNSYGSDMMKRIRDEVNQGQMVGPYGNYEGKINPAIKAISPETALGKELADLRASQTGGNFGPLGTPASIGGKKGGLLTGANTVTKAIKADGHC